MTPIRTTAFALLAALLAGPALADCDAGEGEKVFKKCKTCHQVGDGAKSRLGPVLNGIVGATYGSVEGFSYSKAFEARKADGAVWSEEELDAFLAKPKDHVPGTKMSFAGLRKDDDRANVICYLKQFQ